ncbi:MAG: ornithine carbamoyltransferase [Phycisphaeraceae bacterium]
MNHFISISDSPIAELHHIFDVAFDLRQERSAGKANRPVLAHKTLAMIFEKPSLRTRASFEQAMLELGGHAIVMGDAEVGLGKRETAADVARVLSGIVHGIVARVFEHQKLIDLAQYATIPVINALSDFSHPCQALADAMTIMDEFGRDLRGRTVAYVGDGNNVARSLAVLCGRLGMNFIHACPSGYELERELTERILAQVPGMNLQLTHDPVVAVHDADVLYTDTWVSMGKEAEASERLRQFGPYQINSGLLAAAPAHAIVMHCLPAYRGKEITSEVLEGPRSRVWSQAHNRLHGQKGLLAVLLGGV